MATLKKLATSFIVAMLLSIGTSVTMGASGQPMLKASVASGSEYAERLLNNDGVNGSPQLVAEALHRANRIEQVSVAKAAEYLRQTEIRPCPSGTRMLSSVLNGQLGMVSRPYRDNEFCLWDRNTGLVAASAGCGNIDLERAQDAFAAPARTQEEVFFASAAPVQIERVSTLSSQGGGGTVVYDQGMSTGAKVGLVVAGAVGGYLIHEAVKKPNTVINNNGVCAGANVSVVGNNNATCGSIVTVSHPVVCNPPNQLIGGVCTAPMQCTGGQILVGNTCQCPAGQQLVNGVCQNPIQYCPDGSVRPANGQCPLFCSGGQVNQGGYCSCPAGTVFINGTCRVPPQQCTGGQILVGDYCQCPAGQQFIHGFCQVPPPVCRLDQIAVGLTCQCPVGQQELGGRCQVILQCTGGQVPYGNICQCPPGQEFYAGVCRIPLPGGGQPGVCPAGEVMFAGVCRIPLPGGG